MHVLPLLVLVVGMVMMVPLDHAATLTPTPHYSWRWNSGFAYGYLPTPLKDLNHTKTFFQGYRNGSESILFNKGYAEGCSHIVTHEYKKYVPSYKEGYDEGKKYADDHFSACKLPDHTNDNYLHYYIGFHDGGVAERNVSGGDFDKGENFDQGPAGNSQEYCTGYKAGWQSEFNMEAE